MPDISPGELRFVTAWSLLIRVTSVAADHVVVEHVPSGQRVVVRALAELLSSPTCSPAGFRWHQAHGTLDTAADDEQLLSLMLQDERAKGLTALRIRALDDYLSGRADLAGRRERLATYMQDAWCPDGAGSTLGYVPAELGGAWQERWERAGLPVAGQTEAEALSVHRDLVAATQDLQILASTSLASFLPGQVSELATTRLVALWAQNRRAPWRSVPADAWPAVTKAMEAADVVGLAAAAEIGPAARRRVMNSLGADVHLEVVDAVRKRLRGYKSETASAELAVLLQLSRHAAAEAAAEAAAVLLAAPASLLPEDGSSLADIPGRLGVPSWEFWFDAVQRTPRSRKRDVLQNLEGFARLGTGTLSAPTLLRALGTEQRLAAGNGPFARFSMPFAQARDGLERWASEDGRVRARLPDPLLEVPGLTEELVADVVGRAADALEMRWLAARVEELFAAWSIERAAHEEWRGRANDRRHAESLLERRLGEELKSQREGALASAEAEAQRIQAKRDLDQARLFSSLLTAIQRAASSDRPDFAALEDRVVVLSARVGLEAIGRVGEVTSADPELHDTSLAAGTVGRVTRVGMRKGDLVVVRARLLSEGA